MGGCIPEPKERVSGFAIVDQIRRIRMTSQVRQGKLQGELKVQEDILIENFGKTVNQRSRTTQKALIGRAVYAKNIVLINKYIQTECKRMLDGKQQFQTQQGFQKMIPYVNTLVYSSIFLKGQQLQGLYPLLQSKYKGYKFPVESDIRLQLVKYHRQTSDVTFEMENTYIMQFCMKTNIELVRVNQVGHQYAYSAGTVSYSHVI